MSVSYKKLWKLLIDKNMKKKDLELLSGVSHYTINKLNKGENIKNDLAKVARCQQLLMAPFWSIITNTSKIKTPQS